MEHIKAAMKDFITKEGSGVFVIKGSWGVGKTYLFNSVLNECSGAVAAEKFSYVSLFGVRNVLDIKKEILINRRGANKAAKKNTFSISRFFSKAQRLSDSVKGIAPALEEYVPDSSEINFSLSINGSLICLDDLERKSIHLDLKEVLGFVSELKERKKCKVF